MEKTLVNNVETVMSSNQASGVTVADREGVPLYSAGAVNDIANISSLLIADARNMFPKGTRNKKNSYPIVTLHSSDGSKTTIASKYGETVAFHFKKENKP